jgi:hypothetical protein
MYYNLPEFTAVKQPSNDCPLADRALLFRGHTLGDNCGKLIAQSEVKNKNLYNQTMPLTAVIPEQFPFCPWAIIWWLTCTHKPRAASNMLNTEEVAIFLFQGFISRQNLSAETAESYKTKT